MTRLSTDKLMGFRLVSSMGPEGERWNAATLGDKLGVKHGEKGGEPRDPGDLR